MARTQVLLLLISLAFTLKATMASYEAEKNTAVVVEGMVYCQSCHHAGQSSLAGAEPLPSAKVSVTCKDHKEIVSFNKTFEADSHGYFYAELKGLEIKNYYLDHPLHSCTVQLVSSPNPLCNLFTNVNSGINGSPLRYEGKRLHGTYYDAVVYAAGPVAFRPSYCPTIKY